MAAGRNVISALVKHLWEPARQRLNVVLSIPRAKDHQVIEGNFIYLKKILLSQIYL